LIKPCFDACLEKLKGRVLYHAQFDGDFFEAEILKGLIFKKTGREITLNTLDRVFGIIPAKFKPSTCTLDILSIYCGYGNWDDFYMVNTEVLPTN
jgi:hypothetical protein